jgi:hypothetical protein
LNAGKNVAFDRGNPIRISGGCRNIGVREPFDAWRAVSMCHEEPTLSQYVNQAPSRHGLFVVIFSVLGTGVRLSNRHTATFRRN